MRPPRPKPKPKPKTEFDTSSDSELDECSYESCGEGKPSRCIKTLLVQARGAEEDRRQDDPELAALLQALCDHLEQYQAQGTQLRKAKVKLASAREQATKVSNLQGQTNRYYNKIQALERKLFAADMRLRFPPDNTKKTKRT